MFPGLRQISVLFFDFDEHSFKNFLNEEVLSS